MARPTIKERKQALREQGCVNCGQPYGHTDPYRRIELDHIIAWGKLPEGRRGDVDELQPLCGRCNRYKGPHTYEELNLHQIPDWPKGFDWDRLAWIEYDLAPEDAQRLRAIIQTGGSPTSEFFGADDWPDIEARRTIRYVPAVWVHGELFDVPLRPYDETDMPTHPAPQYLSEPLGREK